MPIPHPDWDISSSTRSAQASFRGRNPSSPSVGRGAFSKQRIAVAKKIPPLSVSDRYRALVGRKPFPERQHSAAKSLAGPF